MRWWARRLAVALVCGGLVGVATDAVWGAPRPAIGPGLVRIDVGVQHSLFDLDGLRVRRGTTVEFVVHNDDPINHELIVGDEAVHARHVRGHEARHPPVPGEVSVGPHRVASTVYTFDEVGEVVFACHLPRHHAFGMHGSITVVA